MAMAMATAAAAKTMNLHRVIVMPTMVLTIITSINYSDILIYKRTHANVYQRRAAMVRGFYGSWNSARSVLGLGNKKY
jgi:hypothetical protein